MLRRGDFTVDLIGDFFVLVALTGDLPEALALFGVFAEPCDLLITFLTIFFTVLYYKKQPSTERRSFGLPVSIRCRRGQTVADEVGNPRCAESQFAASPQACS